MTTTTQYSGFAMISSGSEINPVPKVRYLKKRLLRPGYVSELLNPVTKLLTLVEQFNVLSSCHKHVSNR